MARTGSGKTAAFLVPCLHRLGQHSPNVGARAMVLSPTRELALQTVRFFRQLGRLTNLRVTLITGGFSFEDQFADLSTNPDVLIATPGRLIHILDEANLKLKCMEYVVLDEADRLFEMGFAGSILDILRRCPENRQTALFSATLPSALAEFTGVALHNPSVVRLDTEIRISESLRLAFLIVRNDQKPAALLHLLRDVLRFEESPRDCRTVVFVQTRHHAEFIAMVLMAQGYQLSVIHGNMDQEARKASIDDFRRCITQLLVVTDVAARGLDIPHLHNVINFCFPAQPKLFVHRAGRAGRQGRPGNAYSLVAQDEMPYMVDLHLFLGRPLRNTPSINYGALTGDDALPPAVEDTAPEPNDGYFGALPEHLFQEEAEFVQRLLKEKIEAKSQYQTSLHAQQAYLKSRPMSSPESMRRCRLLLAKHIEPHPLLDIRPDDVSRDRMVNELKTFRPTSTIFEVMGDQNIILPFGRKDAAKRRRASVVEPVLPAAKKPKTGLLAEDLLEELQDQRLPRTNAERREAFASQLWMGENNEEDADFFVPYQKPPNFAEMGYSINKEVTLDIAPDEAQDMARNQQAYHWDKKRKKFIKMSFNDLKVRGKKSRKNEAGQEADLSKKQNYYAKWTEKTKLRIQEAGEVEDRGALAHGRDAQKRFHRNEKEENGPAGKSEVKTLEQIRKGREKRQKHAEQQARGAERKKAGKGKHTKGLRKRPKQMFPSHGSGASSKKYITVSDAAKKFSAQKSKKPSRTPKR
eukprot:TRINITY_DN6925_c0_g1_i1.p1 TRINITY_DN6925_c0_g1~~TRINITY_DN6925_c0_g1_i1.p1  ORF type:complete len:781 (-),score=365.14 TRINITY_DN6925_c0_g1_i1:130-2379(-)